MAKYPLKAISLAAGLATRLKPLSDHMPKAAMPIIGIPSLYYTLLRLEELGITDAAVNSHHLHKDVEMLLNTYKGTLKLLHSYEPEILGTGGCFLPLKKWLDGETILYANPDTFTDLNISAFIDQHFQHKSFISIAALKGSLPGKQGTVWYDNTGRVLYLGKTSPQANLTCGYGLAYFLLSPEIYDFLPTSGFYHLPDAINAAIKAGKHVSVFEHQGYMRDFGDSINDYFTTHQELCAENMKKAKCFGYETLAKRYGLNINIHENEGIKVTDTKCSVDVEASLIGDCFIFGDLKIAKDVRIKNSLIFGDSIPTSIQHIENAVVHNQLVCRF